jgi:hypothetical protein
MVESTNGEVQPLLPILKEGEVLNEDEGEDATETSSHNGLKRFRSAARKVTRESRFSRLGKDFIEVLKDFQDFANPYRRESIRSERRRRLNVILGTLLTITALLLSGLVCFIVYRKVYLPKHKKDLLQKAIQEHAVAAKLRAQQCQGIDWQSACDKISGASARRKLYTGTGDRSREIQEDKLLNSDDPSVTYDNFCLLTYRMRIVGNITFPYHASSQLSAGGNYTMALLIQHGAMRNAKDYFCSFKKLMLEQNYRNFEDILIIAPDFNYENDDLVHPQDLFWNSSKPWGDWR